ncbi:glucose 1-dehydrogenase [Actinomadura sp. LD22]|uniref:Glucose 1-dehydrogenase n=1 Tax=Actinomadura physcomitrii TaxID=2650748 RepID=A0A6I4MKN3_9ACTN|nr:SDR family NAD(P)-dependent oxidoreductase [Actinomadura physcomitrii]MWA03269.1 glucose 1-dehydrogenase [Actinomadura physcomitrii]
MRLDGKTAVVTGAASGMGATEAELFAREGAHVFVCDIQESPGRELAERIASNGGRATFQRLDVAQDDSWAELVTSIESAGEGLHVLVNNAGIIVRDGLMAMTMADWDGILSVNLNGPMLGMRACAPLMRDSGGGSIVNIGSLSGMMGHPVAAYAASKWGLRGLSKSAALELADWRVRVNMIHPGLVHTPLIAGTAAYDAMRSMTPLDRAARPDEVAAVALFLASDDSSFLTGVDVPVDGGFEAVSAYRRVWQDLRERS